MLEKKKSNENIKLHFICNGYHCLFTEKRQKINRQIEGHINRLNTNRKAKTKGFDLGVQIRPEQK